MMGIEIIRFFNPFDALQGGQNALSDLREWGESVAPWLTAALSESPVLAVGLTTVLLLPALAAIGALSGLRSRPAIAGRQARTPSEPSPAWPRNAILEIARHDAEPFPIGHGIVRIGRETDNDVCLDHPSVHRYHALIERTPEAEFLIAYVGDPHGNRLYVNGRPVERQQLLGGEVLDIGAVKLRFTLTESQP